MEEKNLQKSESVSNYVRVVLIETKRKKNKWGSTEIRLGIPGYDYYSGVSITDFARTTGCTSRNESSGIAITPQDKQEPSDGRDNGSRSGRTEEQARTDFYPYYEAYLNKRKPRLRSGTLSNYESEMNKMKGFRRVLSFSDITPDFISEYENYMIKTLKNRINTVSRTIRYIKPVIKRAMHDGLIQNDPFIDYR